MRAFVDAHVAIVIGTVTLLHGTWIDVGIPFVTVQVAAWACALAVSIHILVHALARTHADARAVTALAVIVFAVAADFRSTCMHSRVIVIAVRSEAATACTVPVLVSVLAVGRNHEVLAVAVLVNIIVGHVSSAWINACVSIIAIEAEAPFALTKAIAVIISFTAHGAGRILAVTILVTAVAAHF